MKKIIDQLSEICADAFEKAGFDAGFGRVTVSSRPDLCEFQCNGALPLAKTVKRKPIEIAEAVAAFLKDRPEFSAVSTCMPGFVNLNLSASFLAAYLEEMRADEDLGILKEKKKRIIVDYGGANVAKPLHIGHLRSAVIGEAVKRLGAASGHEMIGDVHLGDWGLQMGLIMEELKDRHQTEFTMSDLEEIYPAAAAKAKETDADGNPTPNAIAFKNRALESTRLLQQGDPVCTGIWQRIMELSKADLKKNYDHLDVHFELWKGESDVQKYIPDMLQDLTDRQIAREDQGALVVDIREEGDKKEYPPCIIRKSDGASLYATTDLATILEREQLYQPDDYIYVADKRQDLHYLSFFRVARKAGYVKDSQGLSFLGFGTMNGKDGKPFKTRSGGVMRLEVLISEIEEAVFRKIRESRDENEISDEEAGQIAEIVGLAALKYGDLSNQASKDYIFDIDRFTSFEGNTGPFLLYNIVRIRSIQKSAEEQYGKIPESAGLKRALETFADAGKLGLCLTRFNDVVASSWQETAPHKLCQYLYETADCFSTFYHNVMILKEEDAELRNSCLALLSLTRSVMERSIGILGFSAPEKM